MLVDNDPVVDWGEKVSGLNFNQGSASLQPTYKTNIVNGHSVVRFDGTEYMDIDGSSSIHTDMVGDTGNTVLAVISGIDNSASFGSIIASDQSGNRGFNLLIESNGTIEAELPNGSSTVFQLGSTTIPGNIEHVPHLISAIYDGANLTYDVYVDGGKVNGTASGTIPASLAGNGGPGFRVGRDDFSDFLLGDIAEVAIYRRTLTFPEVAAAEAELMDKYIDPMDSSINISDFSLWLKSDDTQFRPLADGDALDLWKGRVPSQQAAFEQSSGALQPTIRVGGINGKAAVEFDGTERMSAGTFLNDIPGLAGFTIFNVIRFNTLSGLKVIMGRDGFAPDRGFQWAHNGTTLRFQITSTGSDTIIHDAGTLAIDTTYVLSARYDGAAGEMENWVDGISAGVKTTGVPATIGGTGGDPFALGDLDIGGFGVDGIIGEVLIYRRALNDTERGNIETYLSNKWQTHADVPGNVLDGLRFYIRAEDL